MYACVIDIYVVSHAVKIWKIQAYENVAMVDIFTHSYNDTCRILDLLYVHAIHGEVWNWRVWREIDW